MKIDINKTYRYRNGHPARVLCVDGPSTHNGEPQPVLSMEEDGTTNWHHESGRFMGDGQEDDFDLIEVREPREGWIAAHQMCSTAAAAEAYSGINRVIRVREIID